jgi:serine/threonine-protein kinase
VSLIPGTRLGGYEILAALGAGGMGEVYRAHDTKLSRDVALKILPESFIHDPDRVARFRREAQVLASLNHPHIAAIYGLEEANGSQFLVLELVEGGTLADRLKSGPLAVEEVLTVARQITEALEAAHEKGIIHRDLKPANIAFTSDNQVKVLDFGLAKAIEAEATGANVTHSPTLSVMATQAGVILGTAAYMSPEQAKGLPADHRSDVFSFGVVLYEMLTGRQPFAGETAPEILASVLIREADLSVLPPTVTSRLNDLLKRCLDKNPKKRWQATGDLRAEIEAIAASPRDGAARIVLQKPPLWRRVMPVAVAVIINTGICATVAWRLWPTAPPTPIVARAVFTLPEGQNFTNTGRQAIAISPDGQRLAYVANTRLYLRSLSELEAREIPGTGPPEGEVVTSPTFSPDGQSLVFYSGTGGGPEAGTGGNLKRIAVTGGAAVVVCQANNPYGVSWTGDHVIFGQGARGIMRVPAGGGKPELLVGVKEGERAHGPQLLPDGDAVLFTLGTANPEDSWDKAHLVVQQLRSGDRKTILEGGSDARYLPSGHLVYALGGVLLAVPFDLRRLEVKGGPVPVVEGVRRMVTGRTRLGANSGTAHFSVSNTGSLVYIPGPNLMTNSLFVEIAQFDRKGTIQPLKIASGRLGNPRVSPDGKRLAYDTADGREAMIWIYDLSGTSEPRRLTVGGNNRFPVWSADGQHVAYQSDREGDLAIWWQRADGTGGAERLTKPDKGASHTPESWSPGRNTFLFRVTAATRRTTLWTFSVNDQKAEPFGSVESDNPTNAVFSPNGRWVAYFSDASGRPALWMQPFPANADKYQISADGDSHFPLWSSDGKELFYAPGPGLGIVSRRITTEPNVAIGSPVRIPIADSMLSASPAFHRPFDVAPNGAIVGTAFPSSIPVRTNPSDPPQIQIVLNWFEELKARVPTK